VTNRIEIFKTDVENERQAAALVRLIRDRFAVARVNVDLHDDDKVLRVEGDFFEPERIVQVVLSAGFYCRLLE
jgi:hypothetical protein